MSCPTAYEIPPENTLCKSKSFFVQKDNCTLVLLNYTTKQANSNTVCNTIELIGNINRTTMTFFPEYIEGGFVRIQEAILQYWESKKGDYNIDISDNFDILETFTKED